RGGPLYEMLRPKTRGEAHARSLSTVTGLRTQPLHTDCAHFRVPPRFTILRTEFASNVPTLLVTLPALQLSEVEVQTLRRAVFVINGGRGRFLATIISDRSEITSIRYDPNVMRPAIQQFGRAARLLEEHLS